MARSLYFAPCSGAQNCVVRVGGWGGDVYIYLLATPCWDEERGKTVDQGVVTTVKAEHWEGSLAGDQYS